MLGVISPFISKIRRSYQSNDLIDRLNYEYTTMIMLIAAVSMGTAQYIGNPIQCWVPAEFTGAWEKYTEMYCFVKSTYFLPMENEIVQEYSKRMEDEVGYYQWVPIVLAIQAVLFYLPSVIWKAFNFHTGINVKAVLHSAAVVKKKLDKKSREVQVSHAAEHLREALDMQRELKSHGPLSVIVSFGKSNAFFLSGLYIFTKLLYVVNVLAQFVILNAFLSPKYTFWGYGILNDIVNGREWQESGHFPRVTLCDFNVRVLGNIHHWTVQCVLVINMLNEKIYLFFWWWFIVIGIISLLSFFYWLIALTFVSNQREFVAKYLRCTGSFDNDESIGAARQARIVDDFVRRSLRADGVFLLRLIQTNGGDFLVGEIIASLFASYKSKTQPVQTKSSAPLEEEESPGGSSIGDSPDSGVPTTAVPRRPIIPVAVIQRR